MSNLTITQGQNKIFALTAKDEDEVVLNIDRVWFTVKKKPTDSDDDAVIKKSSHTALDVATPTEIEITDGTNGEADIKLVPSDTASLSPGYYLYDMWVRLTTTGDLVPVLGGYSFIISSAITTRQVV